MILALASAKVSVTRRSYALGYKRFRDGLFGVGVTA